MVGIGSDCPTCYPKDKNCKKSAVKHSKEKSVFLNFVDFSIIIYPRL